MNYMYICIFKSKLVYIQEFKRNNKGKISISTLLVESYRENGKQKRRTIANLTKVPKRYLKPFKALIKNKELTDLSELTIEQGKSIGALYVLNHLAKEIGLDKVLGNSKNAKLALLQIINKIISPCSRLAILESFSTHQAIEHVLKLDSFSLDDLYYNLEWLCENQQRIEDGLFKIQNKEASTVYLYDVTSSYLEGEFNELADYGYNRDGKKGKKQIVIGLLTDKDGDPFSIEVFQGNTSDTKTFKNQLVKLKNRFKVKKVVCVGDKGMIKSAQIKDIDQLDFHYITSITKVQITTLLKHDKVSLELFDKDLTEIELQGTRYILRKNPTRELEIQTNREQKLEKIKQLKDKKNAYLLSHPRAKATIAQKDIEKVITKLKLNKWLSCQIEKEKLVLKTDQAKLEGTSQLDGCYVLKTDLKQTDADKETIHKHYKQLSKVEYAFRTIKTTLLEVRPIFLRKEKRTKGHVFACMLAYKLTKYMMDKIGTQLDFTKDHVINSLNTIQYLLHCYNEIKIKRIPDTLLPEQQKILNALNITLPRRL